MKPTGTIEYRKSADGTGAWWGRISVKGGRPWVLLGQYPNSPQGRARAQETAAAASERLRALGQEYIPSRGKQARPAATVAGETVAAYSKRWLAERERRGLSSITNDECRLRLHVLPALEGCEIATVAKDDIRALVEALDAKVLAKSIGWNTAGKAWGMCTKLFSDACDSKTAALRVRSDNPAIGVRGPDTGEKKSKQWLFPDEARVLLECAEVPLRWRRLYALAIYLYLRPGELAALEWADVNLVEGYVSIHQALDMRTDLLKSTKTGHTRRVPIHAELGPLLLAMRAEVGGSGRVVQNEHDNKTVARHGMPPLEDLAATLRVHLKRAKVERADLFADRPGTKKVTFYDLRATGITWEVLAGTEPMRLMQRAGHKNISTTTIYIRPLEKSKGVPFGPLPDSLISPPETRGHGAALSETLSLEPRRPARSATPALKAGYFSVGSGVGSASPRGFEPLLQP